LSVIDILGKLFNQYVKENIMKNAILVLIWFVGLSLTFAFVGGLMNGLSGNTIFENKDAVLLSILLAVIVSVLGVYKQWLPFTKQTTKV
jgi:hypothetical protein